MENSTLSFALTGVVPAVCDAEAGEGRRSNLTVLQSEIRSDRQEKDMRS